LPIVQFHEIWPNFLLCPKSDIYAFMSRDLGSAFP
jgi:hypothetical protein